MEEASHEFKRVRLDVTLSPTLYEDSQIDAILRRELRGRYEWHKLASMHEAVGVEVLISLVFMFTLAQVAGGFLSELGKHLYATTKGIFQPKREEKKIADSSSAFFHAHAKVGDVEVKVVFQTDAYLDEDSFSSMFAEVMNSAKDMVERDSRIQRCKEVKYEWDKSSERPVPWEAVPKGFPSETRGYYSWNGQDWELQNLENEGNKEVD